MAVKDSSPVAIGPRQVGSGHACFVIAEAGVNHDGDPKRAHRLVDLAAESHADAVKFQTFRPENLASAHAKAAPYQRRWGGGSQRAMLERLVLPSDTWRELAAHAVDAGLVFLSTPFDLESLDLLLELGVQAVKVPSGELNNLPFIGEVAARGLPLIISTGMGTLDEVTAAVEAASAAPAVALLHCVTAYPTPVESSNLRAIVTLAETFRVPVGWSDHTEGVLAAVAAVALGASILEKHFTTDRSLPGPDHSASADPLQLSDYVAAVRATEAGLGDGIKRPADVEHENLKSARRSYHAARDLQPGEVLRQGDVHLLRPATGLPPSAGVVGRVVARPIAAGRPIRLYDLR